MDSHGDRGNQRKQLAEQEYDKFNQQRLTDEAETADRKDLEWLSKRVGELDKNKK